MAAETQLSVVQVNTLGLPALVLENLLLQVSTPTFIQLIQSSKEFRDFASQHKPVLLNHLRQIPGHKADLTTASRTNESLLRLLRQRAANHLYGLNYDANMTEFTAKNATLVPGASAISGLDADYVRTALVFKDISDIRQYTADCIIKERITQDTGVKVLRLVQWQRFISVLCSINSPSSNNELLEDDSSETEAEDEISPALKPTAQHRLMRQHYREDDCQTGTKKRKKPDSTAFRVCHYDIYTLEESMTFEVERHLDYVPCDFAVNSTLSFAILWDEDNQDKRPTEHATLMYYNAKRQQLHYAAKCEGKKLWPKDEQISRRSSNASDVDASSDSDDTPEHLAAGIEFFRYGMRIKLYEVSGIVPFEIVSVPMLEYDRFVSTNVIEYESCSFNVDTPFYGTHTRYQASEDIEMCVLTHLCLGTATIDLSNDSDWQDRGTRILCVLRSQTKTYPEDCEHRIELQKMYHVSGNNATVVARLWGFEEIHSTLTGKNMVAISQGGTRIAISMWNKVYIYALNPKVLCEEVVIDESDDEASKRKKKKRSKRPWQVPATDYYARNKYSNLMDWNIADLRPIVLDLEGAIAHKMSWSPANGIVTDTTAIVEEPVVESSTLKDTYYDNANIQLDNISNAQTVVAIEPQAAASQVSTLVMEHAIVPDSIAEANLITATVAQDNLQPSSAVGVQLPIQGPAPIKGPSAPELEAENKSHDNEELLHSTSDKVSSNLATSSALVLPKPSPRKKDKSSEVTTMGVVGSPKKTPKHDHCIASLPSSAIESKTNAGEGDKKMMLPESQTENPVAPKPMFSIVENVPLDSPLPSTAQQEGDQLCNNSKDAQPSVVAQSEHVKLQDEVKDELEADMKNNHRKRVTEDELVILTDRGIQVWNLGAKAKGMRVRKHLRLEEPLKDLIPRWNLNNGRFAWPPPEDDEIEPAAEVER